MKIFFHKDDLPAGIQLGSLVAIDTETMGLRFYRDRLCLVQLSSGNEECHLIQINKENPQKAQNLIKLLADTTVTKIFHFARFDIAMLYKTLGVMATPLYCTKIASKAVRTYTDRHGLRELCKELLGVEISKHEQTSDWGSDMLTEEQKRYAATDVLYLHALKEKLDAMLIRENRMDIATACFQFLPHRAKLDLLTDEEFDIFQH
jgi:ribonuclease D